MTNLPKTPGEAYEAGLREGAKAERERIARLMGASSTNCVEGMPNGYGTCKTPMSHGRDECVAHWIAYLTEDSQ